MTRRYRMRFVTLVLSLVLLMAMLLTGCGGDKPQPTDAPETEPVVTTEVVETDAPTDVPTEESTVAPSETEVPETEEVTEPAATEEIVSKLSDELFSFSIFIDGNVIQLPCNAADLAAIGWKMKDDKATSMLADGYTTGVNVYHEDGSYITLSIYNVSGDNLTFDACEVDSISVSTYGIEGEHDIHIVGGLKIGSTKDDVIAMFGEALKEYVGDNGYSSLDYVKNPAESSYRNKIAFQFKDDIVTNIDLCYE